MFKIEQQPDKRYRILAYYVKDSTLKAEELYSVSNQTAIEVAQFMKGRGVAYVEDDILDVLTNAQRTTVHLDDSGNLLPY